MTTLDEACRECGVPREWFMRPLRTTHNRVHGRAAVLRFVADREGVNGAAAICGVNRWMVRFARQKVEPFIVPERALQQVLAELDLTMRAINSRRYPHAKAAIYRSLLDKGLNYTEAAEVCGKSRHSSLVSSIRRERDLRVEAAKIAQERATANQESWIKAPEVAAQIKAERMKETAAAKQKRPPTVGQVWTAWLMNPHLFDPRRVWREIRRTDPTVVRRLAELAGVHHAQPPKESP